MPQNYPNPAQHLRSIGASVGDRIRCPDHAKPAMLCYIGNNYALLEMPDGSAYLAREDHNITDWKIAPKPLFTRDPIDLDEGFSVAVRYNGKCIGSFRPGPCPIDAMDMPRIKQVFDTLLDAGLAHLNENPPEHEPPKASTPGPSRTATIEDGDSGQSTLVLVDGEVAMTIYGNYPAARRIFGRDGTLEIARAMAERGKEMIEGKRSGEPQEPKV